jgi:hypothetical protein
MENLKAGIQVIRNMVDFQSHSKTLLFERIAGNEGSSIADDKTGGDFRASEIKYNRRRSRVQRFRGSKFHSIPRTAFGMRIYEKSVSFVRRNPKFGAKLAITLGNEPF